MDEKGVSDSCVLSSEEEKSDSLYPICFGVSCAFFALRLLSGPNEEEDEKWCETRLKMLQGSAQLLGLLVWRVKGEGQKNRGKCKLLQKLEIAEREVEELKGRRREDAKANEKVVGIFAAQEQSWLSERRQLRHQIGVLLNELRNEEKKKVEYMAELNEKLKEMDVSVQTKDKALEEEEQNRKELEEKLKKAESEADRLRESSKEHASEIWKHKTAFIELVSNQRQLEAEMGRALRQVEAAKQELDSVMEQKEEAISMVQKLSMEVVKMRKDSEQKDQILSAMLRKSKLDTAEKQMLLKEVKLSKSRKQAELEVERWKAASESKHERHSLRSMFSKHANSRSEGSRGTHSNSNDLSQMEKTRSQHNHLFEYEQPELRRELEEFSPLSVCYTPKGNEELVDVKRLESWVRSEAEKYAAAIKQRHLLELDAFAEQMRLKDEKLEAFRWNLLSMELESKRLKTHLEGMNQDMSKLRQANMKLEALLFDREAELHSLKEQFALQLNPLIRLRANSDSYPPDPDLAQDAVWSKVEIVKKKSSERDQETKEILVEGLQGAEAEKEEEIYTEDIQILALQSPEKQLEEAKDVPMDPGPIQEEGKSSEEIDEVEKLTLIRQSSVTKNSSSWKMDIHALGVSYKIKRLKQQLLMLERFAGKQESGEDEDSDNGMKAFLSLMSLLNKQVSRYQSLQGKTDEICIRMHENGIDVSREDSRIARRKEEMKTLENFLEETFQLQRYMVATGQKVVEIQSKIASGFVGVTQELDGSNSFDIKRFADNVGTLFRDVQRGLDVRISRIIGDLEGTLACDGIIQFRR